MTDLNIDDVVFGQADLASCDREPIHVPASIQPAGCVLTFGADDLSLMRYSMNAAEFMGVEGFRLGMSMTECFGANVAERLVVLSRDGSAGRPAIHFDMEFPGGVSRDVAVHRTGHDVVVECERGCAAAVQSHLLTRLRSSLEQLRSPADMETLLRLIASELRRTYEYDRVMVYRFASDWSGKVIVEDRAESLESFLGQHFPSSDIPAQARELYKRSLIRVIGDATYCPVPLVQAPGLAPLDMSFMHLRAVSPIHCEYLANMGVQASMSVSLMVDGELWGMIACHHYAPKALTMVERITAKMLGEFVSLQMVALIRARRLELTNDAHQFLSRFLHDSAGAHGSPGFVRGRVHELLEVVACDGGGVWTEGCWTAEGRSVSEAALPILLARASELPGNQIWHSDHLARDCSDLAGELHGIAGAMVIPIWSQSQDYLVLFRREMVQTVVWGGDPNKTYTTGPHGIRLTPRRSFELWKEEVHEHSSPWTDDDLELAAQLRSALMEVMGASQQQKLQERAQAEAMQRVLNDELNHRVKNILAVVQSLVSRAPTVGDCAAEHVHSLQGRIRALAKAHDQVMRAHSGAALRDLLAAELGPYNDHDGKVVLDGPDLRFTERALTFLALLFHELATNAAKYGAFSVTEGQLFVTWRREDDTGDWHIRWEERHGPSVAPTQRSGFGSLLIERAIHHDLGGTARRHFLEHGVVVEVSLPAEVSVEAEAQDLTRMPVTPDVRSGESASACSLEGRHILLVEDEFLVVMDVEGALLEAGVNKVHAAASVSEALDILAREAIDVALLDVNVGNETSIPVARALSERGVPFVFATGYSAQMPIIEAFPSVSILQKPYAMPQAVTMLSKACCER